MKQKKQNTRRTDAASTTPANAAPYPAYKPSGVEWLGDVPKHWEVKTFRRIIKAIKDGTHGTFERVNEGRPLLSAKNVFEKGIYISENESLISEEDFCSIVNNGFPQKGDILLTIVGTIGRTLVFENEEPYAFQRSVCFIRLDAQSNPYFFRYLIQSKYFHEQLLTFSKVSAQGGVYMGDVCRCYIIAPPLAEQAAIAGFLDGATGRIDALVDKKKRLVALLREKRTAMISRAVTGGLDPTAKRKPSGVEWLGDVPEHWEVKQVRRIASRVQTGNTPPTSEEQYYEDGTVLWFGPSSFDERIILERPVKLINKIAVEDGSARLFKAGTVMIVGIGATIGKVSSIGSDASCNQQITGVTFKEGLAHSVFITYQMKQLEGTIRAIAPSATLAIFDQNKISGLWLAIPPLSEQQAIADYLDKETGKIDALIAKVEAAIDKLNEYRTAIISAAVTGKIDVRDAV